MFSFSFFYARAVVLIFFIFTYFFMFFVFVFCTCFHHSMFLAYGFVYYLFIFRACFLCPCLLVLLVILEFVGSTSSRCVLRQNDRKWCVIESLGFGMKHVNLTVAVKPSRFWIMLLVDMDIIS